MVLLSHPERSLKEHLLDVAKFCSESFPLQDAFLKALSELTGRFHDAGKATAYFQEYIKRISKEGTSSKLPFAPALKSHAELSGVLLFYYLRKLKKISPIFAYLSFLAVKTHHSFITDAFEDLAYLNEDILEEQLKNFEEGIFASLGLKELKEEISTFKQKGFKEFFEFLNKELKPFRKKRRAKKLLKKEEFFEKHGDFSLYFYFLSLYSSLLLADRKDVVLNYVNLKDKSLSRARFNEALLFTNLYKKVSSIKTQSPLDEKRKSAMEFVLSKEFSPEKRIYSLNLPTGFGKTLIGFLYALKMRKELFEVTGKHYRIIYALPFLSIIEQNFEVLSRMLKELKEILPYVDESIILKHHHLAEVKYGTTPFELAHFLTEAWESEIVVTTFVQVFNALFPKRGSDALRFGRLANSIIIMDEVQTIPAKYWHLLEAVIPEFSKKLDFYLLFMTATKPALFENAVELGSKTFFKGLNRYQVKTSLEGKSLDTFCEEVFRELRQNQKKSWLFIFNTIASSQEFFKRFKEEFSFDAEYLSAGITPYERRQILQRLKTKKVPFLISTQVVEAGVDIDFDVVIRDFAPFDALIQSAGRCNRNAFEKAGGEKGLFKVIKLFDETTGRTFASYIYDRLLLETTEEVLMPWFNKGKTLKEEDFSFLVENYFSLIKEKAVDVKKEVEPYISAIKYLRFRGESSLDEDISFISELKLIEEVFYKESVFIQLSSFAKEVFEAWKKGIRRLKKGDKGAFLELARLKPGFYDYVIQVSLKKDFKPPFDEELGIYYVPMEALSDYYDKTGLKVPNLIC